MEIIQHYILIQTLSFLMRLPTHQDGFQNRDKVYWFTVRSMWKLQKLSRPIITPTIWAVASYDKKEKTKA